MKNKIEKRVLAADGGEITIEVSKSAEKRMNKLKAGTLECRGTAHTVIEKEDVNKNRGSAAVYKQHIEHLGGFVA